MQDGEGEVCYHFFAGDEADRTDGARAHAARWGVPFIEEDITIGGSAHDWFNEQHFQQLCARASRGVVRYAHAGFPCWTYTRLLILSGILRDDDHPNGVDGLSDEKRAKVEYADALLRRLCILFTIIFDEGGDFTVEQPADTSDEELISFLPGSRKHFSILRMPAMRTLMTYTGAMLVVFFTCGLEDAGPKKPMMIIGTKLAIRVLQPIKDRKCPHPKGWVHPRVLGRGTDGKRRSEKSGKYCSALGWWLARVAAVCFTGRDPLDEQHQGGEIACGSALHPTVRAAVEAARRVPPRFASRRKLQAVPREDRWCLPLPDPHSEEAGHRSEMAAGATADWAITLDGSDDERPESWLPRALRPTRWHHGIPGAPPGPISYEEIWMRRPEDGGRRTGWIAMCAWRDAASAAMLAMARGEAYDDVEDVVLLREWKEEWARDILIDSRDHTNVVRGRRSTRDTIFPGKQISREASRAAAEEVGWRRVDADIVDQAGEGGVETRSQCERVTALIFNHKGAAEFFAEADSVIRDELAAQWVTGPFTVCPPWEPCRSLPRNVAMQTKLKVNAATQEVSYVPKPRVTTNGSAEAKGRKRGAVVLGGLNQGVPAAETAVALDTAGPAPQCGGGGHRLVLRAGCAQAPDLGADQGRAVCSG